jgi:hypothetical protein
MCGCWTGVVKRNRCWSTARSRGTVGHGTGRGKWRWVLLGGLHDLVIEKVQYRAENDPFDTVFVSFSQGLPDCFFLR